MQKLKKPIALLLLSWMLLSVCILGAAATQDNPTDPQTVSSAMTRAWSKPITVTANIPTACRKRSIPSVRSSTGMRRGG